MCVREREREREKKTREEGDVDSLCLYVLQILETPSLYEKANDNKSGNTVAVNAEQGAADDGLCGYCLL